MTGAISRVARVVGIGCVVAALAACTGGGADGPGPDESLAPTDGVPSPSESAEPSPGLPELPEPGPLEEYLSFGEDIRSVEDLIGAMTGQQNLIAACMVEQGFEYTPQVPAASQVEYTEGPIPGTRDFVEDYGYGVWTSPPTTGGGVTFSNLEDPNWDRREAMTEAGREAYDTALGGPITETGDDGSITRGGGCSDVAQGWAVADDAYLTGIRDEAQAFLDSIGADSRFGEVDAAWASCMADAGFSYRTPQGAQQQFWDEMVVEAEDGVLDQIVADERAVEERRVAVADLDCQEATDWAARHRAVEIELQQEYVDAHLAELEALAEAMAG